MMRRESHTDRVAEAPERELRHGHNARDRAPTNGGQTMLLMVLILGSAIVGAASLATILTSYGLRQVIRAQESAQAIFAADTGIEWALYRRFGICKNPVPSGPRCTLPSEYDAPFPETGARFELVRAGGTPQEEKWFSVGINSTGSISRAMEITFSLLEN
ncbi:MAG: hypothetical protein HY536_00610 [Candidatus Colwellbacteria bacterium]|nr:hypothetical protein [Candidatus Colwellbacteria bacterium]